MVGAQNQTSYKQEFLASVVVFLFALPLCLGIAISCGVPPSRGLLAGIIGGIVVGALAGCKLQVTGPAAGLTVIVLEFVQEHGIEMLGIVVAAAGVLQICSAYLRLGRLFRLVPHSVVHGLMTAIGVIILMSQSHIMLDLKPAGTTLANAWALSEAFMKSFDTSSQQFQAMCLGGITIAIMVGWRLANLHKKLYVPEALPAIGVATLIAWIFSLGVDRISVPGSLGEMISPVTAGNFSALFAFEMVLAAFTLAVIASAESMLCTASVDCLHGGEKSDYNRELGAQGVGNLVSGLLGGLPVTGVVVRSSANIDAGAKTRWSAVLHGVWLLVAMALLPFVLEKIPICSLAALLVVTGWKLIDWKAARKLWKCDRTNFLLFAVTVFLVVATDLLTGVAAGVVLAIVIHQIRKYRNKQSG